MPAHSTPIFFSNLILVCTLSPFFLIQINLYGHFFPFAPFENQSCMNLFLKKQTNKNQRFGFSSSVNERNPEAEQMLRWVCLSGLTVIVSYSLETFRFFLSLLFAPEKCALVCVAWQVSSPHCFSDLCRLRSSIFSL